ncbi:Nucleoside-diphosphate-sugar epimerase [Quadrisphaera granulorum]|uniref:Nucleoside-diphosphate-sugar epimerase n=1 Tax=Quadrisphaera granulorum TaxID=317664 RepID=A0A316AZS7_9ACTN|nr:NAD-dependent epimerase/dehydratase family protein [Quadrisphaera granulorum]PWJ55737.1 nucleoside-diphosphate-sugar epimerase [Quadrisphaera granulorum]SZE95234.1 Nucleoside-diphosphate-sugar epimerase [Quadrisphaera granulorum]
MKVLVTGASGLLGGTTASVLAARGHDVTTFQRRPSGVAGVRDVQGDMSDSAALRRACDGIDAVVHLAAKVALTGPEEEYRAINVEGTRALLAAAREAGATRFVQVSSPSVAHTGSSLVGEGAGVADPEHARGPYARTKAAAELIALAADTGREGGFAVVAVRPHIVWGPGDTQLVGRVVERARVGRMVVIGDGTALIDTTYMDDAAAAIAAALDHAADDDAHGRAFVISSGQPRTVGELLAKMAVAGGAPVPTRRIPTRAASAAGHAVEAIWKGLRLAGHPLGAEEPPLTSFLAEQLGTAHWFDQRETQRVLRWRPQVDLDEGFRRVAAWYAEHDPR